VPVEIIQALRKKSRFLREIKSDAEVVRVALKLFIKNYRGIKYVPLWALLPALKNREVAKGYLRDGHKWLGRPLNEREKAYLRDVIEQGNRVEERLRQLGYFDKGPRGKLLRRYGVSVETDEEAEEMLKSLERQKSSRDSDEPG